MFSASDSRPAPQVRLVEAALPRQGGPTGAIWGADPTQPLIRRKAAKCLKWGNEANGQILPNEAR